jgi:hypothetical protein
MEVYLRNSYVTRFDISFFVLNTKDPLMFTQQGQGFAETLVGPENYWPNENGTIFGGFLRNRRHNAVDTEGRTFYE